MANSEKISQQIKFEDRNHVEKLLLVQFISTVRVTPLLTELQEDVA